MSRIYTVGPAQRLIGRFRGDVEGGGLSLFHFDLNSTSLRLHYPLRFHAEFIFDSTSMSLRVRFGFTSNHSAFTSDLLRFHFDLTSMSLRFHIDVPSMPLPLHFDVTSL